VGDNDRNGEESEDEDVNRRGMKWCLKFVRGEPESRKIRASDAGDGGRELRHSSDSPRDYFHARELLTSLPRFQLCRKYAEQWVVSFGLH
jgi:hypothetical protein